MKTIHIFAILSGFLLTLQSAAQDPAAPVLETRIYRVPHGLTGNLARSLNSEGQSGKSGFELFQDPVGDSGKKPKKLQPLQFYLEKSGVKFQGGATATLNPETNRLTLTNSPGEIAKVEQLLDRNRTEGELQFFIYLEMIEVNHADFNDWIFENVMTSDGTALRNEVQNWIREGDAEIVESATVTARSGQRAKVESIYEYIYPTEYNPPSVPNKVTLKDGAEAPVSAASPTAFETRHLGMTLEVDPVLNADNRSFNLNLAPENVQLDRVEQWHHHTEDPRFKAHMPIFHTIKITTQVAGEHGRYSFLGSNRPLQAADPDREDPLILQFVRGDVGSVSDWEDITDTASE